MKAEAIRDWLALSLWDDLGPGNLSRIHRSIPDPWRVLNDSTLFDVIFSGHKHPGPPPCDALYRKADELIALSEKGKFRIITIMDPAYPTLLAGTHTPPPVLFTTGNPDLLKRHCLAIVGTRRPSPYGRRSAKYFSETLSLKGFVIVSGMAIGIDAIAHTATVDCGGETIAVLGCGIDNPYPKSNASLRAKIEATGCIITEFPWGTPPTRLNFPVGTGLLAAFRVVY